MSSGNLVGCTSFFKVDYALTLEKLRCWLTVQVLYPSHCVEGSWGAELHPEVIRVDGAKIVKKGTDVYVDAYSGFADNNGKIK